MSIRIHELAKRHNMEGKEMLAFLKERGYVSADTRSVSSTVNKIYEEEVDKEFAQRAAEAAATAPAAESESAAEEPAKVSLPAIFVKSKDDVAREREEAKTAAAAAAAGVRAPAPAAPLTPPSVPPPVVIPVATPPPARPAVSSPPALPSRPLRCRLPCLARLRFRLRLRWLRVRRRPPVLSLLPPCR